ncbi:anti-sigma factor [Adhaeretor mobilis]|uniref:Uncharacterized protein n=1 Tax=Adhaeretor mobilis TaxID=1930276 RepID=A0A517MS96_9BACT|nr:hypothetical protein [Adhaeretor mobilis]QDS97748.1 hypothetical protein HG15A2_10150 [Adhaeretor mobilis]
MKTPPTDAELDAFLDEGLSAERMDAIESAIGSNAALAERIAQAVGRRDAGLHTLGAIWRRHRLTCPTREQLGSHLMGVLPSEEAKYLQFHVETIGCRKCQASLADLKDQLAAADQEATQQRRSKYFETSAGYLGRGK